MESVRLQGSSRFRASLPLAPSKISGHPPLAFLGSALSCSEQACDGLHLPCLICSSRRFDAAFAESLRPSSLHIRQTCLCQIDPDCTDAPSSSTAVVVERSGSVFRFLSRPFVSCLSITSNHRSPQACKLESKASVPIERVVPFQALTCFMPVTTNFGGLTCRSIASRLAGWQHVVLLSRAIHSILPRQKAVPRTEDHAED